MDKIKKYRKALKDILVRHSKIKFENMPLVKSEVIIDTNKRHFVLMDMGWSNLGFIHKWVFHLEIKEDKVYLHKNMTDFDIVEALIENGIKKTDIVISILEEPTNLSDTLFGEAA